MASNYNIKLDELKSILIQHSAFSGSKKLENLAKKYGLILKYIPKKHCELNPIEGLWCFQKQYIRLRTDQRFPTMKKLINESRNQFVEKNIHLKLLRRFWYVLDAYKKSASYGTIINTYFS